MNAKKPKKTVVAENLEIVTPITAAGLRVLAVRVQNDVTYLLLPRLLEQLQNAAQGGVLACRVRMDHLINELATTDGKAPKVCPVEVGKTLVRELVKLGFASQLGQSADDRNWERLCLEVNWREELS